MPLTSRQLTLAADALDALVSSGSTVDGGALSGRDRQTYLIAAEDARREVQAASGFANPATLALRIVVDNDRAMVDALTRRARTIRDRDHGLQDAIASEVEPDDAERGRAFTPEEAATVRTLTVSYLADDLRDFLRDDLRERVYETGRARTAIEHAASNMVSAMAAHALDAVDWISVASEYLHRADQTGEWAPLTAEDVEHLQAETDRDDNPEAYEVQASTPVMPGGMIPGNYSTASQDSDSEGAR